MNTVWFPTASSYLLFMTVSVTVGTMGVAVSPGFAATQSLQDFGSGEQLSFSLTPVKPFSETGEAAAPSPVLEEETPLPQASDPSPLGIPSAGLQPPTGMAKGANIVTQLPPPPPPLPQSSTSLGLDGQMQSPADLTEPRGESGIRQQYSVPQPSPQDAAASTAERLVVQAAPPSAACHQVALNFNDPPCRAEVEGRTEQAGDRPSSNTPQSPAAIGGPAGEPIPTPTSAAEPSVDPSANLPLPAPESSLGIPEDIFGGGADSLVARAIGHAEGTRTAEGGKTAAYSGHRDPGNGAWNLGTFSYQHGARSPAEADQKQLVRLRQQAETLFQKAQVLGMSWTLEEWLNALDLANQSPRAALNRGGYTDRLKQAQDQGLTGSKAIVWARTYAFLDPDTGRWTAPGLGNTLQSIRADQARRQQAIARVMATVEGETAVGVPQLIPQSAANRGAIAPPVQAPAEAPIQSPEKEPDAYPLEFLLSTALSQF